MLVQLAGQNVAKCLHFELSFFPTIVFWDKARNLKMKWNKKSYIDLYKTTVNPSAAAEAAAFTGDVCSDIEKRDLSYSRNLSRYQENWMRWMEESIKCLPRSLDRDQKILTVTKKPAYVG